MKQDINENKIVFIIGGVLFTSALTAIVILSRIGLLWDMNFMKRHSFSLMTLGDWLILVPLIPLLLLAVAYLGLGICTLVLAARDEIKIEG